ncbi:hypothetical protein [Anabaena sp. CCY 0017]|uniref:hypothetical protein n=1 Tax=Anabaena sp. CCY 0017 TaxID=3103866 RepID=UPI0039C6DF11
MVTTVVVINTLISLVLLYIAWRVWKLKQWIGRIADKLNAYERHSHGVLYKAPENIGISQQKIHSLRQGNEKLQVQIQQVRQIISLLLLGKRFWGGSFNWKGLTSRKKTAAK